jgi:hypothetical protein
MQVFFVDLKFDKLVESTIPGQGIVRSMLFVVDVDMSVWQLQRSSARVKLMSCPLPPGYSRDQVFGGILPSSDLTGLSREGSDGRRSRFCSERDRPSCVRDHLRTHPVQPMVVQHHANIREPGVVCGKSCPGSKQRRSAVDIPVLRHVPERFSAYLSRLYLGRDSPTAGWRSGGSVLQLYVPGHPRPLAKDACDTMDPSIITRPLLRFAENKLVHLDQ